MAAGSPTSRLTPARIVDAARRIGDAGGYDALSLRTLAASLDVTAPALYDHFASKDDLLRALAEIGYRELGEVFEQTPGDRAIERCRSRARRYVEFARANPQMFRLMFQYRPAAILIAVDNELPEATKAFESGSADVAAAITDGDLATGDIDQINLTIWAAMHGVATVALVAPELADQLVDDVIDAVFGGLAPR